MTHPLRLIIFDVDGTLVDSQGDIVAAMRAAFDAVDLVPPARDTLLSVVGLSLDHAMDRLVPDQPEAVQHRMVGAYRDAYFALRAAAGADVSSPLYPGARDTLDALAAVPENLLGVATGKSQRGLDKLLEAHGLAPFFCTRQVADHHPSKPHPSMICAAMAETGAEQANTVMIGDTTFDMEMARAAGVAAIGVGWGYHPVSALQAADLVIDEFEHMHDALDRIWSRPG